MTRGSHRELLSAQDSLLRRKSGPSSFRHLSASGPSIRWVAAIAMEFSLEYLKHVSYVGNVSEGCILLPVYANSGILTMIYHKTVGVLTSTP